MIDLFGPVKAQPDAFSRELAARVLPRAPDAKRDRRPHRDPEVRPAGFIGPIDPRAAQRFKAGNAENAGWLTRKTARAIPMREGMREYNGEPDRARVGLVQIAVQTAGK